MTYCNRYVRWYSKGMKQTGIDLKYGWRLFRTKLHCHVCHRKQAMYENDGRLLCGWCIEKAENR